jgi:hypothetical protein
MKEKKTFFMNFNEKSNKTGSEQQQRQRQKGKSEGALKNLSIWAKCQKT